MPLYCFSHILLTGSGQLQVELQRRRFIFLLYFVFLTLEKQSDGFSAVTCTVVDIIQCPYVTVERYVEVIV